MSGFASVLIEQLPELPEQSREHRLQGNFPDNLFACTSMKQRGGLNEPIDEGMLPEKAFPERIKLRRSGRLPRDDGIVPDQPSDRNPICVRLVSWPSDSGIERAPIEFGLFMFNPSR